MPGPDHRGTDRESELGRHRRRGTNGRRRNGAAAGPRGASGVVRRPLAVRQRHAVHPCVDASATWVITWTSNVGHGAGEARQELGRLPWLALFFLRDFFLRPRLLMANSNTDPAANVPAIADGHDAAMLVDGAAGTERCGIRPILPRPGPPPGRPAAIRVQRCLWTRGPDGDEMMAADPGAAPGRSGRVC